MHFYGHSHAARRVQYQLAGRRSALSVLVFIAHQDSAVWEHQFFIAASGFVLVCSCPFPVLIALISVRTLRLNAMRKVYFFFALPILIRCGNGLMQGKAFSWCHMPPFGAGWFPEFTQFCNFSQCSVIRFA